MRDALSTLIFRPIDQFGCATAMAGVMPERSFLPRKGPPEAVSQSFTRARSEAGTP